MKLTFIQQKIIETIASAPDNILLMSRKNCHQKGLDSIVINQDADGRLTRIFLAHSNHSMWKNNVPSICSLGIHDHKYNIRLTHVKGVANNITAKVLLHKKGFFKYEYSSMLNGNGVRGVAVPVGLEYINKEFIGSIFIPHTELHTVSVPKSEKAAWLVEEGSVVKETTTLITHLQKEDITSQQLYKSFESKQEVLDTVVRFFNEE